MRIHRHWNDLAYRHVIPSNIESRKFSKAIRQYGRSNPSNFEIRFSTAAWEICREHSEWRKYERNNLFASELITACCIIESARLYVSPLTPEGSTCRRCGNWSWWRLRERKSDCVSLTVFMLMPHCESVQRSRQAFSNIELNAWFFSVSIFSSTDFRSMVRSEPSNAFTAATIRTLGFMTSMN